MFKLLLIPLLLIFTACSIETLPERSFNTLCAQDSKLVICNEREVPEYTYTSMTLISIQSNLTPFIYTKDKGETYSYMTGETYHGDCEDWVITFIENNLREGYLPKNSTQWMIGYKNKIGHAWALITLNNITILFDTFNPYGVEVTYAYQNLGYAEVFAIYKY